MGSMRQRGGRTSFLALAVASSIGLAGPPFAAANSDSATALRGTTKASVADVDPALRRAIERTLFAIERDPNSEVGYRSYNRVQQLDASFVPDAVSFSRKDGTGFGLRTERWGRGELLPVAKPLLAADANRIELRRGPLVEWYLNTAAGYEQGFTLTSQPSTQIGDDLPVTVELALLEGAVPRRLASGEIEIVGAGGTSLAQYGGLHAVDAAGQRLPATMEPLEAPPRLRISVRDAEAVYPITIDPMIAAATNQVVHPSPAVSDLFGYRVAIDGDTAVVGVVVDDAPALDSGSAYVFVRTGGIVTWTLQQQLVASDGANSDEFGDAVGISGETIVVGAPLDDGAAGGDQGSAYVFTRSGTVWTQQQKIVPADAAAGDWFGYRVSIDDKTVAIGAPFTDAAGVDAGSAYVFTRSGTTWTQQGSRLLPTDLAAGDACGVGLGLSADTVLLGCYFADPNGDSSGAAYVFRRSGTTWAQEAKLLGSDNAAGDQFGIDVALDGNTALVGARYDNTVAGTKAGSAYVFTRSGVTWSQQAHLFASDAQPFDSFGFAVAVAGDIALVGAPLEDGATSGNAGAAYLFSRTGTSWTQDSKIAPANAIANDRFGYHVALDGRTAVIGRPYADVGSVTDSGSAQFYDLLDVTKLVAPDEAAFDRFGTSVAISGDTAVVGAPYVDEAGADAGAAYIFERSGATWVFKQKLLPTYFYGQTAGARFGAAVAIDGARIAVGAPSYDYLVLPFINFPGAGGVMLYHKIAGTWSVETGFYGDQAYSELGSAVDVDDAGHTLVAGALFEDVFVGGALRVDQGAVFVYDDSGGTWSQRAIVTQPFAQPGAFTGYNVAVDLPFLFAASNVGDTYLFYGGGASWSFAGSAAGGRSVDVSAVGPFNGFYAWAVPAAGIGGEVDTDSYGCIPGACSFTRTAPDAAPGDQLGYHGLAFDAGYIAAGAPFDADYGAGAGSAYVWDKDGSDGSVWVRKLSAPDAVAGDWFGFTLGVSAGHVIVGAHQHGGAGEQSGTAYVYSLGICGNGRVESGEICDDGNRIDGDGCSSGCRLEVGCNDGIDNDGDGKIDFPNDPGCGSPAGTIENPQCNDGIDNDGDGLIDLVDSGCGNTAANNREASCGMLGAEALLPLAAWSVARRRRSSRRVTWQGDRRSR